MSSENLYKFISKVKDDIDALNNHYKMVLEMNKIPDSFVIDFANPICPICKTNCKSLRLSNFPKWIKKMFERRRKELA